MARIIVVPADNGIAIGTFIFDSEQQKFAYSDPITYTNVQEAVKDYHDAVVNDGELPFQIDEGLEVWLLDLDSGASYSFWQCYRLYSLASDNASTENVSTSDKSQQFNSLEPNQYRVSSTLLQTSLNTTYPSSSLRYQSQDDQEASETAKAVQTKPWYNRVFHWLIGV